MARTLLQQALPTSFGLKAAGWLIGIEEAIARARRGARPRARRPDGRAGGPARPGGGRPRRARARARAAGAAVAHRPVAARGARRRARHPAAGAGQDRPRRDPARAGRGRRGPRGRRRRPFLGDGGQAQPGRPRCPCWPAPRACPGSSRRCWPACRRSTSAPPAPGRRSGARSPTLLRLTGSAAAWTRELLEGLEVDPGRMRANLTGDAGDLGAAPALVDRALLAAPERRDDAMSRCGRTSLLAARSAPRAAMFDANAAELEARTALVRYDHRGHGTQPIPAGAVGDRGLRPRRARPDGPARARAGRDRRRVARRDGRRCGSAPMRRSASSASCWPARRPRSAIRRCGRSAPAPCAPRARTEAVADAVVERWLTPALRGAPPRDPGAPAGDARRLAGRGLRPVLRGDRPTWTCARISRGSRRRRS